MVVTGHELTTMRRAHPHLLALASLLTLSVTACPGEMDDATITSTLDSLETLPDPDTLSATVTSVGSSFPVDTTDTTDSDTVDTGPGPAPCDLTPVYVFAAPAMERPWMRALHDGCTVEEIVAGAERWTLENGDTDPPHVSPPGLAPGTFDLDPHPYPDSLDASCVIVMWGLDNKAPIVWRVNLDGEPVVSSGFVMNGGPERPAWLDGDVWRGAFLPGDPPTCMPVEI
jgi:hypothetical protein